ncbi:MAG: asparagine synthase-related protein, partial [Acidimicrobiia bacterium]
VKVELRDEADLLGRHGTESLTRFGLVWPPGHYMMAPLLEVIQGGSVVTGQGGDEVLGRQRVAPFTRLLKGGPARRQALAECARELGPRKLRRRILRERMRERGARAWLLPAAHEAFLDAVVDDLLEEPLRWKDGVRSVLARRVTQVALRNQAILGREMGIRYVRPFLDGRFVEAFAHSGGVLGFPDRRAAMHHLFGHLLPSEVIRRRSKAAFNTVAIGPESRAFIARWDGRGIDSGLVDPEKLEAAWLAPHPNAGSLVLLQAAWLAHNR